MGPTRPEDDAVTRSNELAALLAPSQGQGSSTRPGSPLRIGSPCDRFVVEAELGEGGAAVVYRVRHRTLDSSYALKLVTLRSSRIRERVLQEGRIQARLNHPNIVTVHDVLTVDGLPALVMDLVEGPSLTGWMADFKPTLEEAERVFRGIVDGLAEAHKSGVIHRDLKPDNVLMARETDGSWRPRITDFGLARVLNATAALTRSGNAMGTPAYMAPEQIRDSRRVDERADLFSMGCILYEMVCHQRAFDAPDIPSMFNAILSGEFAHPLELRPTLPPRIAETILACLAQERWQRPQSCSELIDLLDGVTTRTAPSASKAVERPSAPPGPPEPGKTPGSIAEGDLLAERFRLLERIGQGRSATVFRAVDQQVDRLVAVKVLHPHLAGDALHTDAFRATARALSTLRHPNIVRLAAGPESERGTTWYAMELLTRGDLRRTLADLGGPMRAAQLSALMSKLGGALQQLHDRGQLHRAVTPANVLFDEHGEPRLTDPRVPVATERPSDARAKASGDLLYAAPEWSEDPRTAGPRSDQFSLARVAMFCLHGRPLNMAVVYDPGGFIRSLSCPPAAQLALARGTSPDPFRRFESIQRFSEALIAGLSQQREPVAVPALPEPAPPSARERHPETERRNTLLFGAGLVVAAAVLAAMLFMPDPPSYGPAPIGHAPSVQKSSSPSSSKQAAPPPTPAPQQAPAAATPTPTPNEPAAPEEIPEDAALVTLLLSGCRSPASLRCQGEAERTLGEENTMWFTEARDCWVECGESVTTITIQHEGTVVCDLREASLDCGWVPR